MVRVFHRAWSSSLFIRCEPLMLLFLNVYNIVVNSIVK
jgi:hypothetical protein